MHRKMRTPPSASSLEAISGQWRQQQLAPESAISSRGPRPIFGPHKPRHRSRVRLWRCCVHRPARLPGSGCSVRLGGTRASQIAFVFGLTALRDEVQRTSRVSLTKYRSARRAVRPVRARLERICLAVHRRNARGLARENGHDRVESTSEGSRHLRVCQPPGRWFDSLSGS